MRTELKVGDVAHYRAANPEKSFFIVYLGDGFYFRDGVVRRNRKKLHKIAAASTPDGRTTRFHRWVLVDG